MILSKTDKNNAIKQISNFFEKVSKNEINSGQALKNSLMINYIFVATIWLLGFSIIGVIINILITYIKGFLVGFSVTAIFVTYGIKGFLANLIYVFPSQLINMLVIITVAIYSIMLTHNLIKIIVSKKGNNRLMLKKYFIILMFCIIISFISSLIESYIFPTLLKIIIKLYI